MPENKTVTFDASQWQPIETAPKDGMTIILSNGNDVHTGEWVHDEGGITEHREMDGRYINQTERDGFIGWMDASGGMQPEPTHWMPLPAAPGSTPTPAAQSAGQEAVATFAQGIEAAAKWLEKRAEDYANEFGHVDPDTGTLEFGIGQHASHKAETHYEWIECAEGIRKLAAPVNGGERALGQVIDERDQYHDAAEKLADAIAKHFGVEIGEHSNLNCPWQNALDHIAQATKRAADAQQVGGDEHANRYRVEKASGGFWPNAVRCGTGTRELFVGHKKQCERVAAELKTAFEDGRFVERTAALTSPAKVPDAVMQALDRMSTPLHDSRLSGLTAELDAANIKTIRDYVLSGAMPAKVVGDDQHPDDAAVDRFSVAMKAKLAKKRAQGRGGWDDERICSPDDLARMLVDHVRKGDPVDVGNLAMMLFNRPDAGAALCRAARSAEGGDTVTLPRTLIERLLKWRLCMSYNDSYFGEPAGELKRLTREIQRKVDASEVNDEAR